MRVRAVSFPVPCSARRELSGKFTLERAVPVADLKTTPREELLKAMVTLAEISLMRGA